MNQSRKKRNKKHESKRQFLSALSGPAAVGLLSPAEFRKFHAAEAPAPKLLRNPTSYSLEAERAIALSGGRAILVDFLYFFPQREQQAAPTATELFAVAKRTIHYCRPNDFMCRTDARINL